MRAVSKTMSKRVRDKKGKERVANSEEKPKQRVPTAFEMRVYKLLKERVPKGSVTSYAALANVLKSSARAVGGAMKRNPFAPSVPCHRVVCADGSLGGFKGKRVGSEVTRKERMLRGEGVVFDTSGKVEVNCFVKFD
jgi:methylated-DNA-[protein]-cysteine S-methyltransferase